MKDKQKQRKEKIIKYILSNQKVHYQDIMDYTNLSRKTVARYLDLIESDLPENVNLVRKRNEGIYFTGKKDKLTAKYGVKHIHKVKDKEMIEILHFLIKCKEPILLDDLAEHFYLSKSTLQRKLNSLKDDYGLIIESSNEGIFVNPKTTNVQKVIADVIRKYWSPIISQNGENQFTYSFNLPSALTKYISQKTLNNVQECIQNFAEQNKIIFDEFEYESLLIHTAIAIQRILKKEEIIAFPANQNQEILKLTNNFVQILERKFKCIIPKQEILYLNLHMLAIYGEKINDSDLSNSSNYEIVSFLKGSLKNFDDVLIKNLAIHLQPAIHRSKLGISIKNPYKLKIKKEFPYSIDLATQLAIKIDHYYHVQLNDDEICYIALHFELFNERNNSINNRVKLAIVCSTGLGSAELIKQQLLKNLTNSVEIVKTMSVQELLNQGVDADIIVTTIPMELSNSKQYVLKVNPLLSSSDMDLIKSTLKKIRTNKYINNVFMALLDKETIVIEKKPRTQKQVIQELTTRMFKKGYVDNEMYLSAIHREKLSSTSLGKIAIPHGDIRHVKHSNLAIYISKSGINWGKDKVNIIFFIAFNKQIKSNMDQIYSYLYEVIQDQHKINKLINSKDAEEVLENI